MNNYMPKLKATEALFCHVRQRSALVIHKMGFNTPRWLGRQQF